MYKKFYVGVIGMIVEPEEGLVTDGSAKDAIPPTLGLSYFWLFALYNGSGSDGEFCWMTFVMGTCCWVGDVGSFTKACVVVLFVLEGICVVS